MYKVDNEGYDFAGYSFSLDSIVINHFTYFIFLIDTVLGPFLPRYLSKKNGIHI